VPGESSRLTDYTNSEALRHGYPGEAFGNAIAFPVDPSLHE
jgi:hypothetical protein